MGADGVVADLHVHTTNSDGELALPELPAAAERAGLEAVAVTDHDRLHPELPAGVTDRGGLTVVHGIELRVEAPDQRVDLLGYAVEPTDALAAELDRIQADRIERGRRIIANVESHLGIDLPIEAREGIGRPHVARAVAAATEMTVDDAFTELIGEGRPCYVARDVPTFERGLELLGDACPVVGLAHPLRYDDPAGALALCPALDAVERWYPYGRAVDPAPVERAIAAEDLLATGGSDAHDDRLGRAGLDHDAYGRFEAAASG